MLYEKIENLRERTVLIRKTTEFFEGELYPVFYACLVVLCSFTGAELPFYAVSAVIVVYTTIFCRDTKSLIVPLVLAVYAISQKHTPQPPYNSDFLYRPYVLAILGSLLAPAFAAMLFRLIAYKGTGNVFRTKTKARFGLFALGGTIILNGIFYSGYTIGNLFFGIGIALSFVYFYIYFYNTLEWNEKTAVYVARILLLASAVIMIQFLELILFDKPDDKLELVLGWGMSNNIGGMLAMFMPASFYLSYKSRFAVFYYIFGFVIFLCIIRTMSRTSLITAIGILLVCMILLSVKGKHTRFVRTFNALVLLTAVLFVLFPNKFGDVIQYYIERGLDDSGRKEIWENGIKNFLQAPIFGSGFYTPIAPDWSYNVENWIFPDMYHNTFVQLLATCGVAGAAAYLFHVAQGMTLIFTKVTEERIFVFLVILSLSLLSLADNHLFHVFPTLVYSMLFALSEKDYESEKRKAARTASELPLQTERK